MFFNKKKSNQEEILENKEYIAKMANSVDLLISLMEEVGEENIIDELKYIQDEIKYFNPSASTAVAQVDNLINNRLQDIKLAIVQGRKMLDYTRVQEIIDELVNDLIVTRKSKENN